MRRANFIVKKRRTIPITVWAFIFVFLAAICTLSSIRSENGSNSPVKAIVKEVPAVATVSVAKPKKIMPVAHDQLSELETKFRTQSIAGMESLEREKNSRSLRITLNSDVFFQLGTAKLEKASRESIQKIIEILKPMSAMSMIEIEGHTDDSPVIRQKVNYPSNWELSAARAASLVPLFAGNGFFKDQLKIIGYGDSRPLFSNHISNRMSAKNRRIVLRVFTQEGERKI